MSMERYLCDTCLYANNCQFIAKHKEGATGCSAYINTFGVSVDRIREICAAERDGRLVVLPCKRGDTVWRICGPKGRKFVADRQVLSITMYDTGEFGLFTTTFDWLGETVFLTREEAEAALDKQKGE